MTLRICERCRGREMVRKDNPHPLCLKCRTAYTHLRRINKRRKNNECIRCGHKLLNNKGILTCKKCRDKYNEKKKLNIITNAEKDSPCINKASLEVEDAD